MSEDINAKDFQELRREVAEMKTAFIGINGSNGIRGDVSELKKDVKELTKTMEGVVSSIQTFKDELNRNHKIFAYKKDVSDLEHQIILKLNEMDRKRDLVKKEDEYRKVDLSRAKLALTISIIGLTASTFLSILKFFI